MSIFLSKNIRTLRKNKQLSQQKLAESLEISRSKIASYESGSIEPKIEYLLNLSRFFEVDLTDLICKDLSAASNSEDIAHPTNKSLAAQQYQKLNKLYEAVKELHEYRLLKSPEVFSQPNTIGLVSDFERILELLQDTLKIISTTKK